MRMTGFLRFVAFAGAMITCSDSSFAAEAAAKATATQPAGARRALPTTGLTQYNLGNGVQVHTNTPGAISSFTWSTGSSSGRAFHIGR
jgi:hypothetical protein